MRLPICSADITMRLPIYSPDVVSCDVKLFRHSKAKGSTYVTEASILGFNPLWFPSVIMLLGENGEKLNFHRTYGTTLPNGELEGVRYYNTSFDLRMYIFNDWRNHNHDAR